MPAATDRTAPPQLPAHLNWSFPDEFRIIPPAVKIELPNYFLADLGDNSALSGTIIRDAAQTLKRNRNQYLATRKAPSLVKMLDDLGDCWLDDDFPFRQLALREGPKETGFSESVLQHGLDSFFKQLNGEALLALLQQDLGDPHRLDSFVSSSPEQKTDRRSFVRGPELITHFTAGTLPCSSLQLIVLSLLSKSAQFIKCASGASYLPRLFAHSIYDMEPKLGSCIEIADWPGGNNSLESELFEESDLVTISGSDETIANVRSRIDHKTRFIGYGNQLSFAYITKESLGGFNAKKLIKRAAEDVAAWDQSGCLSPHVIYVEHNPDVPPEIFASRLAEELAEIEQDRPRSPIDDHGAADIAGRRSLYEVRAAHSPDTQHWTSEGSTAWTVVYEAEPQFSVSCLNRFIYVKAVHDIDGLFKGIEPVHGKISTVALAAGEDRANEIAQTLATWGVTRICPVGKMQDPPFSWRHDGRPALADFLTWTDWES